jgi:hypothetical protein
MSTIYNKKYRFIIIPFFLYLVPTSSRAVFDNFYQFSYLIFWFFGDL